MHMTLDVNVKLDEHMFNRLMALLLTLNAKVTHMSQVTDELKAAVAAQTTVIGSAVTAIRGFPAVVAEAVRKALEDAGTGSAETDAAVLEATNTVKADTNVLLGALTEGTGEPPVPIVPVA